MTRRTPRLAPLALACGLLAAAPARAELPDPWDRAREPRLLSTQRAVDTAYEMALDAAALPSGGGRASESRQVLLSVRSLLETAGAAAHPDPALRFFYGDVLAALSDDAGTVAALEPAVAAFPDHPDAIGACYQLAIAYARLQRREDEARAYERYLARQTLPHLRASALYNYGDALMSLGDLTRATANYRSAIELEPGQSRTGVLARWGLAVALDRSGDIAQALATAKEAVQLDTSARSLLHDDGTFFVPEYEIHWYDALRHWALAELATNDVSERRRNLELSAVKWQAYVASAPSTDPWVALAQARFRRTQHLLAKASGGPPPRKAPPRAGQAPPPPWARPPAARPLFAPSR
ncbi:MAG TPA: tetratricopeptide repeat protein [Polyangiaceae bacterium]|nr:tetratricopeptide repeat protein [Polyangiaceae bacterium]